MKAPDDQDEADGQPSAPADAEGAALPASLIEDLTAQKTADLRIELARSPAVALATVVHALASCEFYQGGVAYHPGSRALKISMTKRSLRSSIKDHDDRPAVLALDAECERLGDILPGNHDDLFAWCLNASQDMLLDVLAVGAAHGVDVVESKSDPNRGGVAQGPDLAAALKLDMTGWYAPDHSELFQSHQQGGDSGGHQGGETVSPAPSWEKLKKAELAAVAEREASGTGWQPSPLR